jgi:hypothetical protein
MTDYSPKDMSGDEKTEWDKHVASHGTSRNAFKFAFEGMYYTIACLPMLLFWGIAAGTIAMSGILAILATRTLLLAWVLMLLIGALYNNHVLVTEPIGYLPCIPIAFLLVLFFALVMPSHDT